MHTQSPGQRTHRLQACQPHHVIRGCTVCRTSTYHFYLSQIASYLAGLTARQRPVEEKHTDMTKIPQWPVAKYRWRGIKIASAITKMLQVSVETKGNPKQTNRSHAPPRISPSYIKFYLCYNQTELCCVPIIWLNRSSSLCINKSRLLDNTKCSWLQAEKSYKLQTAVFSVSHSDKNTNIWTLDVWLIGS